MDVHAQTTLSTTRRPRRLVTLGGLTLAGALALAACSSSSSSPATTKASSSPSTTGAAPATAQVLTPPSATVALTETGSTLLYPLFNLWGPAYTKQYPNITLTTAGTGSGTGISQAAAGAINIGASDAYLSSSQVSAHPGLLNIPLAISAQMINYNLPGVSGHIKLDPTVIARMYEGKITTWNDAAIAKLNPGVTLPATRVVPLHRIDGSGDTFLFSQYLSKGDPADWGANNFGTSIAFPPISSALGATGNGGMVSECAKTVGCIAYIGISYQAQTQQNNLGEALIANGSGNYVLPSNATIDAEAAGFTSSTPANGAISMIYGKTAAQGYPIINYEYAIVSSKQSSSTTAQAIRALLSWAINPNDGNASSFLSQVGFRPLPPSVVSQSQAQLQSVQ